MKTKILFFLPNLNGGGAERVTVNILRQLDLKKFEIRLALVDKSGVLLELIPSKIIIIDLKSKKTILSIFKLRKIICNFNPDIIFSTLIRTHIAIDLSLTGIKNKPKLIYRSPTSPKHSLKNKQLNELQKKLLEKAYRNADIIIAQTPEMKDEIVELHKIDSDRIQVMLNPIDTDLIDKKIQNTENPFDTNYINVVSAGRLTKEKGFDILIQSFKIIVNQNNEFRLYIIGEDVIGLRKELINLVKSLDLTEHVFFLGFQTNPYMFFSHSDLYVLSSRWEGLPNTILENLYIKKPIVATKCIPFMEKLIENGKNGFLIDVEDKYALAESIINYKKINTDYIINDFNTSTFENILLNC